MTRLKQVLWGSFWASLLLSKMRTASGLFRETSIMTVKKAKTNARQKKVLKMVNEAHTSDMGNADMQRVRHDEDAIRRQLLVIKKDYSRLMTDVATGYGLIKDWVNIQASTRGELLKTRFIKN